MLYLDTNLDRRLVTIKSMYIPNDSITLTEFLLFVKDFAAEDKNEILIEYVGGIKITEIRFENDEEYNNRILKDEEYKLKVQANAENSWKRQQEKYAKARRKN